MISGQVGLNGRRNVGQTSASAFEAKRAFFDPTRVTRSIKQMPWVQSSDLGHQNDIACTPALRHE